MIEQNELLENLKKEADSYDIKYTESATINSLTGKINAYKKAMLPEGDLTILKDPKLSASAMEKARINRIIKSATKLSRVQVTCNDPRIRDREGCYRSVSNKYVKLKKVFTFDTPTHLPQMMIEYMKGENYLAFTKKKGKGGFETTTAKEIPTFNIQELPALTAKEFQRIALRQQAESVVND